MKSWGKGEWGVSAGGTPPPSPIFCNHLFVAVTLKNYKLCYLNLN